jgi:hypothetical protein
MSGHLIALTPKQILGAVVLAAIKFLLPSSLFAADITKETIADTHRTLVTISGPITQADQEKFSTVIQHVTEAVVSLDSPGGSLIAGLEIGKKIRLRNYATFVADGSQCASVCALMWLGGTRRFLEPRAAVGFHAAYVVEGGNPRETGSGNALVGAYLTNLGLDENAVVYITQAPPDKITWLDEDAAKELGIRFELLSDSSPRRVLAPASETAPPPENSPLTERAAAFIKYYWENVGDADDFALEYLASAYAPVVRYYGKDMPKEKVLVEKRQYIKRWPTRKTIQKPGTLNINCIDDECTISGVADYEVSSDPRKDRAAGTVKYSLTVRFEHGSAAILSENSEVMARR